LIITKYKLKSKIWVSNWRIKIVKSEVEIQKRINEENKRTNDPKKWLENFFFFHKEKNPKDTQNFIKKNPIPN